MTTDQIEGFTDDELEQAIASVREEERGRRRFLRQLLTERGRRVVQTRAVKPNRVHRDQCDEALEFVTECPGCSAEEMGVVIYPWDDFHEGYRLRNPETTKKAFAERRLLTLLESQEVVRRHEGGCYRWWVAEPAS